METLVELYDKKEMLHNTLGVHCFHPKRLIFLADFSRDGKNCVDPVKKALCRRYPSLEVETLSVSYRDEKTVRRACEEIAARFPSPVFDMSGGNDVVSAGVNSFCDQKTYPRFYIDSETGAMVNLGGAEEFVTSFSLPRMKLEDFVEPTGASLLGRNHRPPDEEQYESVLRFFQMTLKKSRDWNIFCNYLQEVTQEENRDEQSKVFVDAPDTIAGKRHKQLRFDPEFARLAFRCGFIEKLRMKNGRVYFRYTDDRFRRYLTSQGVWLEMFIYIASKRIGGFDDCRMSVQLDWNGVDREDGNVMNEIDVVLTRGITAVFVSCKTSVPTTDDLNEILLYSRRFGGRTAKCLLATTASAKQIPLSVKNRATEMGVRLVCGEALNLRYLRTFFSGLVTFAIPMEE